MGTFRVSRLIAIDPSTKATGYAIYNNGCLMAAGSCTSEKKNRVARTLEITVKFEDILMSYSPNSVAFEDPMLKGRANSAMQRIIGALELGVLNNTHTPIDMFYYYNPGTVKKQVSGDGRADKFEVALSAGELLKTEAEKEILAKMMDLEDFDACDAIAVGLTHFKVTAKDD